MPDVLCDLLEPSGIYWDLSQLRLSGLSLTAACLDRVTIGISGCGVRGSGRCRPDGRRVYMGNVHRREIGVICRIIGLSQKRFSWISPTTVSRCIVISGISWLVIRGS